MKVTDVRVRKLSNDDGKMKAIVSLTIDEDFVVHDIRVVEGQNGLFVAMPSRKTPSGEFRDVAHPITTDARAVIQDAVLKAYEDALHAQEQAQAQHAQEQHTQEPAQEQASVVE